MNKQKPPINIHDAYHAHVYYEQETIELAQDICKRAGKLFNIDVGRAHQKPVGPHPMWSCQLSFSCNEFEQVVPWLAENRLGLSILVHGLTGNNLQDHTDYAYWLGEQVELRLAMFRK